MLQGSYQLGEKVTLPATNPMLFAEIELPPRRPVELGDVHPLALAVDGMEEHPFLHRGERIDVLHVLAARRARVLGVGGQADERAQAIDQRLRELAGVEVGGRVAARRQGGELDDISVGGRGIRTRPLVAVDGVADKCKGSAA